MTRTTVERVARFAVHADVTCLGEDAGDRLKRSVLDGLGCAIGALGAGPTRAIRTSVDEFGGRPACTLIGGGATAPDRAALYNGALVRYLDFMDNYALQGEVCHPVDNLAALLAAGEYANASGSAFLVALAVSYQIQGRLLELPAMRAGVNYTTPLAFSVAAGASRLLDLDETRTAHALALAGVVAVSLAVIQAEPVSQWKGLASAEAASRALHNTLLARNGITGPLGVFDGPHGMFQLVDGSLPVDWSSEALDIPLRTSIKKHNAEFQSQTSVDLAIELRQTHALDPGSIIGVQIAVPDGAYQVLGGGVYGPKTECHIKEQADHNLKYLLAVALIDGEVWPAQFSPERINRPDVQSLLTRVDVRAERDFTGRVPDEMPVRITIHLQDGRTISGEKTTYRGFHASPMSWQDVQAKFDRLTAGHLPIALGREIAAAVLALETVPPRELANLLGCAHPAEAA
jgi:2-methylcitrate dehydratase